MCVSLETIFMTKIFRILLWDIWKWHYTLSMIPAFFAIKRQTSFPHGKFTSRHTAGLCCHFPANTFMLLSFKLTGRVSWEPFPCVSEGTVLVPHFPPTKILWHPDGSSALSVWLGNAGWRDSQDILIIKPRKWVATIYCFPVFPVP